jgi:hypothetical protein
LRLISSLSLFSVAGLRSIDGTICAISLLRSFRGAASPVLVRLEKHLGSQYHLAEVLCEKPQ